MCGSPSYPQEIGPKTPCGHLKLEIILNFIPFSDLDILVIKFLSEEQKLSKEANNEREEP